MQLRKHFLFIACAVLCVFSLCALPSSAYADEALGADAEAAVAARMREIGNRYEVGDILSEDDARFVRDHLRLSTQPQPRESWTFTKTGSGYGTTVVASGDVFNNGTLSYTWGGKLTATKTAGGTPQRLTGNIRCEAYGLMGTDGVVGKIYDDTITHSVSQSSALIMNQSRSFTGVAAFQWMSAWVDVVTSGGQSFTIQGWSNN